MAKNVIRLGGTDDIDTSLLIQMLDQADSIFVKKLSNNDRNWTWNKSLHQYGPYIPAAQRDEGFFPPLVAKVRSDSGVDEIREVFFRTEWPQLSTEQDSRLVNYRSKGEETHLTGVPKAAFTDLSPSSYFAIGRVGIAGQHTYRCLTIDSASDDAVLLADALDLPADFQATIKIPARERAHAHDQLLTFAEQLLSAWQKGEISNFSELHAAMPSPLSLANEAREQYLNQHGLKDLNPFEMESPGDAIRDISRTLEWALFRQSQLRSSAIALVRLVLGDEPSSMTDATLLRRLVGRVQEIDALMLSASQQRKSRAGLSFEHHIEAMLLAGGVPFKKQVVIEGKKRPDFILPSLAYLRKPSEGREAGMILSAKTTLRERWKQVKIEMGDSDLFLATVDENIAGNAIEDMNSLGIVLVVPETLKAATSTEYQGHKNVLSFREVFHDVLRDVRMPSWAQA